MKAPTPSEAQIQRAVVQLLCHRCEKRWRYTAIPLGGYRMRTTAGQLKAAGVNPGWPDLIFVGPAPKKVFFLELKKKGGRLSAAQEAILAHFESCGIDYAVASSIEEAVDHLKQRSILKSVEL